VILLVACCACRAGSHDGANGAVVAIIHQQEAAWNRGDIEGFMKAGYLQSPDLTFFSGGSDTRGFDPVLARYLKRYKAEGKEMGHLAFTKLEVVPLADDDRARARPLGSRLRVREGRRRPVLARLPPHRARLAHRARSHERRRLNAHLWSAMYPTLGFFSA
jgi:hypothetical protein